MTNPSSIALSRLDAVKNQSTVLKRFKSLSREYIYLAERLSGLGMSVRHNMNEVSFDSFFSGDRLVPDPEDKKKKLPREKILGLATDPANQPIYGQIMIGPGIYINDYGRVSLRFRPDVFVLSTGSLKDSALYDSQDDFNADSFFLDDWAKAAAVKAADLSWTANDIIAICKNLYGYQYLEAQLMYASISEDQIIEICVYCDHTKSYDRNRIDTMRKHPLAFRPHGKPPPYPIFLFGPSVNIDAEYPECKSKCFNQQNI